MPNLMVKDEPSIIDSKLSLPHRTEEDRAAVKVFPTDRDVIVMESEALPSAEHILNNLEW